MWEKEAVGCDRLSAALVTKAAELREGISKKKKNIYSPLWCVRHTKDILTLRAPGAM